MTRDTSVTDEERQTKWRHDLLTIISGHEERLRRTKDRWNAWYYSSLYGAVLASAFSALVLKSEGWDSPWRADVAALFATLAAVLGTLSAAGNFQRRWRTARLARSAMQKLIVDLQHPSADLGRIATECKHVIDSYQEGAIGREA